MPFPTTVLPVRVRIAPGGQPAADPATWVWVDITQWVRVASGITIEAGRKDEGDRVDPGKCSLTLDNTDGRFSTRNVLGPWYGRLAKGTPLRVGTLAVTDAFDRTVTGGWGATDTGQTWSLTGSAALWSVSPSGGGQLSITAANVAYAALAQAAELLDVDVVTTVSVPAVMTGASTVVAVYVRYADSNNFYWGSIEFNPGGTLTSKIRKTVGGTLSEIGTTGTIPSISYSAGQRWKLCVQADGPALRTKIWPESGDEPDTWHLNVTDTDLPDAGLIGFFFWCLAGNTNTKPFSITVDDLEAEAVEFTGTVPEWPPRWDKPRKDVTSPLVAAGILRRLQQGKSPLKDPITRMVLGQAGLIELWPFTDDSNATVAASALPGGIPAPVRALEFAQTTPPLDGAQQTAQVTASTVVSWQVRPHTATGTWGVVWFAQLPAPPAASTVIMSVNATGTVRRWDVVLDSTTMTLLGYNAVGTQIYSSAAAYGSLAIPPMWIAFDLLVTQSGSNIDAKLLLYGVDPDNLNTAGFFGTTVAGTVGSPTGGRFEGSLGYNEGRIGPIAVFNAEPQFVSGTFFSASNGYVGESAAARIGRLCAEENVQVVVEPGDSEPCGPQRTAKFLDLLYAAADADLGVLYERGAGLAYRPRGARYNRAVELPLDFDAGDVAEPPEPTDDDQQLRNQWTITRDGGSSAVASDQESIDRNGLMDDSATLNVAADDVLPDHAGFRTRISAYDEEYRWPSITLNLRRNPGQIRLWRAAKPWPRMTIGHEPDQVTGNAVDVTVVGYRNVLEPLGWTIELVCVPTRPWLVPEVDDDTSRVDTDGSQLAADATSTATSLSVAVTDGPLWTTDPDDFPLEVNISGIRITVTAISGSSSPQTWTVVRLVDGFDKDLSAGDAVRLWAPSYPAL